MREALTMVVSEGTARTNIFPWSLKTTPLAVVESRLVRAFSMTVPLMMRAILPLSKTTVASGKSGPAAGCTTAPEITYPPLGLGRMGLKFGNGEDGSVDAAVTGASFSDLWK